MTIVIVRSRPAQRLSLGFVVGHDKDDVRREAALAIAVSAVREIIAAMSLVT
jgi:hypothetical protein